MRLSQNSGVPIYQQIADSFKSDILAGKYAQVSICRLSEDWRGI